VTRPPLRLHAGSGDSRRATAWLIIGLLFFAAAVVCLSLAISMGNSLVLITVGSGELLAALACAAAAVRQRRT
jgi:hypothetical protein